MLSKKLAYPAAALVLLSSTAGLHRSEVAHAKSVAADYSGTVAIADYQFPDSLEGGVPGAMLLSMWKSAARCSRLHSTSTVAATSIPTW